jgi:poly(3-hydroxybutyrate) depolymerase
MLYNTYELQRSMLDAASIAATAGATWWNNVLNPLAYTKTGNLVSSALQVFAHAAAPYGKPEFGFTHTVCDGQEVAVTEEVLVDKPFGRLLRFARDGRQGDPKLLIVAPMSGHYATLLRGTVERMLPRHDVHITDWADAKMVPLSAGSFDLDDYIDYVIEFLHHMGPGTHIMAVCQPAVPVYAALCLMGGAEDPCTPVSATLMGGPVDPRQSPTAVNTLATRRPFSWFEHNVVAEVPVSYPGAGRRVYPGFLQLAGFMSMNLGAHMVSHWEMFKDLVQGDDEEAEATKAFYEEYRSVADIDAAFYLQTIDVVFQRHLLPKGQFFHRGVRADPAAVRTPILAIEGERDDISGLGQTQAALKLSTGLPQAARKHHVAMGAGHYGIFNGRRWREQIAPVVDDWIAHWAAKPLRLSRLQVVAA